MDFLENKELIGLKQDIKGKESAVEADKYRYEKILLNGLGDEIKNYLDNPPKPSKTRGLKLKFLRYKKIISEGFRRLLNEENN